MRNFRLERNGLIWEQYHEAVRIEPWGPDSLRVRATAGAEILEGLQKEVEEYLEYYHYERPHLGLDMRTSLSPVWSYLI